MTRWHVRPNVSGGAGGSRWQHRAEQKDDARFSRRLEDSATIAEGLYEYTISQEPFEQHICDEYCFDGFVDDEDIAKYSKPRVSFFSGGF